MYFQALILYLQGGFPFFPIFYLVFLYLSLTIDIYSPFCAILSSLKVCRILSVIFEDNRQLPLILLSTIRKSWEEISLCCYDSDSSNIACYSNWSKNLLNAEVTLLNSKFKVKKLMNNNKSNDTPYNCCKLNWDASFTLKKNIIELSLTPFSIINKIW